MSFKDAVRKMKKGGKGYDAILEGKERSTPVASGKAPADKTEAAPAKGKAAPSKGGGFKTVAKNAAKKKTK